jgi:L-threonylcarbamoyladenylate synthase
LRLAATAVQPGEAVLRFAGRPTANGAVMALDLSPTGDLAEAAANLFGHLRRLDAAGAGTIAVGEVPAEGLGEAINDRLARAAAPRP